MLLPLIEIMFWQMLCQGVADGKAIMADVVTTDY